MQNTAWAGRDWEKSAFVVLVWQDDSDPKLQRQQEYYPFKCLVK